MTNGLAPRARSVPILRRAVVVGGGIAGCCAARALLDAFDEVWLVERDRFPDTPHDRPGVPQGPHSHALLSRGRAAVERSFPGFEAEMLESGAHLVDLGRDVAVLSERRWMVPRTTGTQTLFASRALLEATLRRRLRHESRCILVDGTRVLGLLVDPADRARVRGVRTQKGEIAADLVVDAAGRRSRAPEWLATLGLEPVAETHVDAQVGYSSRRYRPASSLAWPPGATWSGVMLHPKPPDLRAALLFPIESRCWIVSIVGIGGNYPPSDEDGFEAALRALRSPLIARAVEGAEPITGVYSTRGLGNMLRHYERWGARLAGFVAVGDSVCSPNPVYAQGMTLAALSATALAEVLRAIGPLARELPGAFFRAQERLLRDPWRMAVSADFRFEQTIGIRPPLVATFNRYFDALFDATADDPFVQGALYRVVNMEDRPLALLAPRVCARVGLRAFRRRHGRGRAESAPMADA